MGDDENLNHNSVQALNIALDIIEKHELQCS